MMVSLARLSKQSFPFPFTSLWNWFFKPLPLFQNPLRDISSSQPRFQHHKRKQDQKTRILTNTLSSQSTPGPFCHPRSPPRLSLCCNIKISLFTGFVLSDQAYTQPARPWLSLPCKLPLYVFASPPHFSTASPPNFQSTQVRLSSRVCWNWKCSYRGTWSPAVAAKFKTLFSFSSFLAISLH